LINIISQNGSRGTIKGITQEGKVIDEAQANYHLTYRAVNSSITMFTELNLMIYDSTNVKIIIHLLTSQNRVLLEKHIVTQLVKTFSNHLWTPKIHYYVYKNCHFTLP
jgi:hypothetical protein